MRTAKFGFIIVIMIALVTTPAPAQPKREHQQSTNTSRERSREASRTRTQEPGSNLSETQQKNLDTLKADLRSIKQGSQVTREQKDALKNSLTAIADGATKPDPALVQQLATDLNQVMADADLTPQEMLQIANDLQQVMNSANIPKEEVEQAIADTQAILTASGVSQSDVQKIVADLQAIATEAQKNAHNAADNAQDKTQLRQGQRPAWNKR